MREIRIFLSGEFIATYPKDTDYQCGYSGCHNYFYEVDIRGNEKVLKPPDFFYLDNDTIHQYFKNKYTNTESVECQSCEVMCQEALNYFICLLAIDSKLKDTRKITVMISGRKYSRIESSWINKNYKL